VTVFTPNEVFHTIAFYQIAIFAILTALLVVSLPKVHHAALALVGTLCAIAAFYVLLSADFLAGVQVLIYVGAVMVLVLFAIMLTPQQVQLPALAAGGQRLAAFLVAAVVLVIILSVVLTTPWPVASTPLDAPTTALLGASIFQGYILPLEIAGTLLLIAMIGAIVVARED